MATSKKPLLAEGDANDRLYDIVRTGITNDEVIKMYDMWAATWEKDCASVDYNPPLIGATEMAEQYPNPSEVYLLDCASGTGLVGMEMYKRGFRRMDCLDASMKMVEECKKKGIYENCIHDFMGPNRLNIPDNTYDALVSVGCFCEGHVDGSCLAELIRIVKPGGKIVIAMREKWILEVPILRDHLEDTMKNHEDNGKWRKIKRVIVPDYHDKDNGIIYVFQVC